MKAAVKKRRATPKADLALKTLSRRPRSGYTVSEFAKALGISMPAANMALVRMRDAGKAMIVGQVQAKTQDGRPTRYANVWRAA